MDFILLGLGAIIGGFTSWYISKFWSQKSSKETPEWVNTDLVKSIKDVLAKRPEDVDWTTKEIVKLYRNSVYKDAENPKISDINHCADCGNENLTYHFYRVYGSKTYSVRCEECKWSFMDNREDIAKEELDLVRSKFEIYQGVGHHHDSYIKLG